MNGEGCAEGLRVYDPAFLNTAVVKSQVSYVDGERGILLYRGYRIEDLLKHSNYLEVAYLLIYGELPDKLQAAGWEKQIMTHTYLHVKVNDLMKSFNYDAHPMGMFISSIAALSTFHPEANPSLAGANIFLQDVKLCNKQFKRIIGKATTLAANAYRHRIGREFNSPQNGLGYTENFLCMLDCLGEADYRPHPVLVDALDKLFIIHAEHEMNCSTTAMRLIGSSLVDPYSAISGAAAALYGPLHGGANEAVVHMLEEIGSVENIPDFIAQVKNREKKLMGFGHRVYKNFDPRASLVRDVLYKVFEVCGQEPLMKVAVALEQAALNDDYFVSRRLYPNVDFYSGLIYKAMGFPTDFFPLLFAIPRISGWLAHWNEMLADPDLKIWRPRQVYTGEAARPFVPMSERPIDEKGDSVTASHSQALYKRYALSRNRSS
ncbi:Citrate synthase [Paramicrosporidium saccamoebae]|uniref:Citrate synthase n=1 Tax=Paramicrosporidium saccamoebae TaxID=1246581 RepID=A0A2H9TKE7_9FUNG|nr:Citrate synthase [Paramicrosporidium saccamoebae]